MRVYKNKNIASGFSNVLRDLVYDPDYIASPRDMEVREIKDCAIEISNPMMNLYRNKERNSPTKYIAAELLFYFAGTNNPTFIENYASLWKDLHNPDGTINSAYGNLIFNEKNEHGFTQYGWVIESLKRDKDTRQAFMHFNKPSHQFLENKDQVCTLQSLFHIRENKLHMTITMRSNDVIYGFMTDWAFFSILQYHVFLHMKKYYPELELGSYTHISHSMHLYEKHYDLVEKMLKQPFYSDSIPLLDDTIVDEQGNLKDDYSFLSCIKDGITPDYNTKTTNPLIYWCLEKLR